MNWGALLQVVLNVFEKNPQLAESLLASILNLFVNNPTVLNKAVTVGIAQVEKSLGSVSVTPIVYPPAASFPINQG